MKRVVITGIGVIASNGIGKDGFWDASLGGVSGVKPISLFDTADFLVKRAGEASNFDPAQILGPKGLRTLDRSTKLVCSAAKLAFEDAHFEVCEENSQEVGVVVGTSLGSIHSIAEFDRVSITEGPQYVNPAFFPNTVINSPASQVSIKFGIRGFNSTIATGFCSGLDGIGYAAHFLRQGRIKAVLAGGVEELCIETFLGFYNTKCLAGINNGGVEVSCPFDKRRNGVILGEGGALVVLEELEHAQKRNAPIYAEIVGYGQGFDGQEVEAYNPKGEGLKRAMRAALEKAKVAVDKVDYICAAANSSPVADKIEASVIRDVFGDAADKVYVSSVKSMLGETMNASGALHAIASVGALEKQMIPPTINYREADPECNLNHVTNQAHSCKIEKVLINAFGPGGYNSSIVISKFRG